MPGTEEQLNKEMTTLYVGFDPSSDSLHIGSLVPILLLVHLQDAGHKPIALVGGATGMVGDPSGKSEERNLLSEEVLNENVKCIKKQLEKYLNFDPELKNSAVLTNNYEWFRSMNFLDFIRDIGKNMSVNYMLSKESVKKRLESENGISFTEFSYQLIQGYDFYWLFTNMNCKLQLGGSDQWGNIITGTELIRRKTGGEAFAFTCPLIKRSDGGKFGKTEKGNVWLDPHKTSPYQFYQFWINASDDDANQWIKIFTRLPEEKIEELISEHNRMPHLRLLQLRLAKEVTSFVHGVQEYEFAKKASEILFGNATTEVLKSLSEVQLLEVFEGVPTFIYNLANLNNELDLVTFLADTGVFPSKSEARKTVLAGGVSINKSKIENIEIKIDSKFLLNNKYILVQKGKKNYFLIKIIK